MPNLLITSMGGAGSRNIVDTLRLFDAHDEYSIVGTHFDVMELAKSDLEHLFLVPRASDEEDYIAVHAELIERFDIDFLIPNSDAEAATFSRNEDKVTCNHMLPDSKQISKVQDKYEFHTILSRHGCATVPNVPVRSIEKLDEDFAMIPAADQIWVRLRQGSGSAGATWLSTADQAQRWIGLWCELRGYTPQDFVLSSFLPGRDFCTCVIMQDGEFAVGKIYERLGYWHSDVSMSGMGSTPKSSRTVSDTLPIDETVKAVRAISEEFGLVPHGLYQADLKCDPDGRPCVTEINGGRLPMTSPQFDRIGEHILFELYLSLIFDPERKLPRNVYDLEPGTVFLRGPDLPMLFVKQSRIDELERTRL